MSVRRRAARAVAGVTALALLASCASGEAPTVPAGADGRGDPVLVEGRTIWTDNCARCHGASGGGGAGPKLSGGRVIERYPDVADQVAVVTDGRGAMPGFGGQLSTAEIDAVMRYTREVLAR